MKKIILICLLFFCASCPAYAIDVSADSACLICADTGEIIYAKNEKERRTMASTTKIMTGILALENSEPSEIVAVSKNAERQEGTSIYLREGERISMTDLVYGLMLNSGNDAAVAIAEHVSGSVDEFAKKMNEKAAEIGAKNTSFKNPNGLDSEGHYTTAYDLALIGAYAMKNDKFREIVGTKSKTGRLDGGQILYFSNHNKLLNMYDGAVGIKTGFTKASGRCLVSAAEREGVMLIAVTLNAPDDWNDHKKMLDFGFERIKPQIIVKKRQILKSRRVDGKKYNFLAEDNVTLSESGSNRFDVVLHMPENIPVPLNKGEKVGEGEVRFKGRTIAEFNIVSEEEVAEEGVKQKKSFFACIDKVFKKMLNIS